MSEAWSKSSSNIRAYDFEEMHLNQGSLTRLASTHSFIHRQRCQSTSINTPNYGQRSKGPYEHPPSSSGTRLTEQYAISKNSSQPEQTPSRGPSGGYAFAQRTLNQGEWPKQQTHAISNAPDQQLRAAIPGGFAQPQSIATDYTQHQNFIISEAPETKHRSYGASMDLGCAQHQIPPISKAPNRKLGVPMHPQSSQMPSNTVFQPTLQTRPHISFRSGGSLTEPAWPQTTFNAASGSHQSKMSSLEYSHSLTAPNAPIQTYTHFTPVCLPPPQILLPRNSNMQSATYSRSLATPFSQFSSEELRYFQRSTVLPPLTMDKNLGHGSSASTMFTQSISNLAWGSPQPEKSVSKISHKKQLTNAPSTAWNLPVSNVQKSQTSSAHSGSTRQQVTLPFTQSLSRNLWNRIHISQSEVLNKVPRYNRPSCEFPRTQPLSTAPLWSQQSRMPILENPNRQLELRDPSIAGSFERFQNVASLYSDPQPGYNKTNFRHSSKPSNSRLLGRTMECEADSISARRSLKRKLSDESESEKQSVSENIPQSESKSAVKTPSEEIGNRKYPGSVRNIRMENPDEVINAVLDDLQRINQTGPTGLPTNDPVAQSFSSSIATPALLTTSASDSSNRLLNSPRLSEATLTPSGNDLASQSSAKGATQSDSTESNLLQSHTTGNYENLVADSYNNPDADLEMNPTAQIFEAKLKDLEKNNHSHTNNTLPVTSEIPIPQDVLEFLLEKMADSP